jgi:predicted DNA-binding transcriptional regulator AlpA
MDIHDLQNLIRMGRTATYRLTTSPSFPKPYAITGKALRWDQKEILDWLDGQRVKEPRGRVSAPSIKAGNLIINGRLVQVSQ